VTTDKAGPHLRVLDDLVPAAAHVTEQYSNNRIEADSVSADTGRDGEGA
jgi:transposase-like protein